MDAVGADLFETHIANRIPFDDKCSVSCVSKHFRDIMKRDKAFVDQKKARSLSIRVYKKQEGVCHRHLPQIGDVLAFNSLWSAGHHYNYIFYKVTSITPKGNVSGKLLQKYHPAGGAHHLSSTWTDLEVTYGPPVPDKKARRLQQGCYELVTPDRRFTDGGCVM